MNKTKYLLVALIAVLSLVIWGSRSFADDEWVQGTVQGYYMPKAWDAYEAGWLVGHKVFSSAGGELGQIADLLIDRSDGHVAFVILSNVPGFEDRYAAAPFQCLVRTGAETFNLNFGNRKVSVPPTYEDALAGYNTSDPFANEMELHARTIGFNRIPENIDAAWADAVYRFYGIAPYWTEASAGNLMFYRATEGTTVFVAERGLPGLIGAGVESAKIDDLVIDPADGRVVLVVFGNVAGRGDAMVAVPFSGISMSGNAFVFTAGDKFASAPEFGAGDLGDQRKAEDIYRYFGAQPYWTTESGVTIEHHESTTIKPNDMGSKDNMNTAPNEGSSSKEYEGEAPANP